MVYNHTHMWLARSTPASRAGWAQALDAVAELDADTLVAGHRDPLAADDEPVGRSTNAAAIWPISKQRWATPRHLLSSSTG